VPQEAVAGVGTRLGDAECAGRRGVRWATRSAEEAGAARAAAEATAAQLAELRGMLRLGSMPRHISMASMPLEPGRHCSDPPQRSAGSDPQVGRLRSAVRQASVRFPSNKELEDGESGAPEEWSGEEPTRTGGSSADMLGRLASELEPRSTGESDADVLGRLAFEQHTSASASSEAVLERLAFEQHAMGSGDSSADVLGRLPSEQLLHAPHASNQSACRLRAWTGLAALAEYRASGGGAASGRSAHGGTSGGGMASEEGGPVRGSAASVSFGVTGGVSGARDSREQLRQRPTRADRNERMQRLENLFSGIRRVKERMQVSGLVSGAADAAGPRSGIRYARNEAQAAAGFWPRRSG
jgi:hypothetical protein